MEDRYLYKAKGDKRYNDGSWYEGYLIKDKDGDYQIYKNCTYRTVMKDTICQCTGLKDKNGKLIWENDIVKHYNNIDYPETYDIGIVYWDNYQSGFERTSRTAKEYVYINGSCIYEVIGNVFDNPELLENKEED